MGHVRRETEEVGAALGVHVVGVGVAVMRLEGVQVVEGDVGRHSFVFGVAVGRDDTVQPFVVGLFLVVFGNRLL